MSPIDLVSRPALAPGTRLVQDFRAGEWVLVWPEGVLHLNESAYEIARRCDGKRTLQAIVDSLATDFEGENLQSDIMEWFVQMQRLRLLSFSK